MFSLDNLSSDVFQDTLFIRPDAPPDQRVEIVTIPLDVVPKDTLLIKDDLAVGRLVQPVNATLSPDGKYALFAVQEEKILDVALYIYDIERNVCGRVNLDVPDVDSWSLTLEKSFHWLSNNRVLIGLKGLSEVCRLYELKF